MTQTLIQKEKKQSNIKLVQQKKSIIVGANNLNSYLKKIKNKRVGIVTNQSGLVFKSPQHDAKNATHLIDTLLSQNINIIKIFSPEHGFRGKADAGEKVNSTIDPKTGIPIVSLHGKNKKPTPEQLNDLDVVLFDIQDVGVRFYTYISTMTYVMQACAKAKVPLILLDRPNPNAHYIDGPVLEKEHSSFLGLHEVPLVYGMTIGEYAKMVCGEQWINPSPDLTVIKLQNWDHNTSYKLPVRPSPNLPNTQSINLYPSLGFFEGTTINAGRGTEHQFQVYGSPYLDTLKYKYRYRPKPNFGSKYPKENGKICYGQNLKKHDKLNYVNLDWIVNAYNNHAKKNDFFKTSSFTLHAGNKTLQQQIIDGKSALEIRALWLPKIADFKKIRAKYLLYN